MPPSTPWADFKEELVTCQMMSPLELSFNAVFESPPVCDLQGHGSLAVHSFTELAWHSVD